MAYRPLGAVLESVRRLGFFAALRKQPLEFSLRRLVIGIGGHEPAQFGDCLVEAPLIAKGNHDEAVALLLG